MAPPKNAAQSTRIPPKPRALVFGEFGPGKMRLIPALEAGPRVVAKCFRGSGDPETVTVGTDGEGLGFDGDDEELVIVNRDETE